MIHSDLDRVAKRLKKVNNGSETILWSKSNLSDTKNLCTFFTSEPNSTKVWVYFFKNSRELFKLVKYIFAKNFRIKVTILKLLILAEKC